METFFTRTSYIYNTSSITPFDTNKFKDCKMILIYIEFFRLRVR